MLRKLLLMVSIGLTLGACSSSTGPSDRKAIQIGEEEVSWSPVLGGNSKLRALHPDIVASLGPNENIYIFGAHYPADVQMRPTGPYILLPSGTQFYGAVEDCERFLNRPSGKPPRNRHIRDYNACIATAPKVRAPQPKPPKRDRRSLPDLIAFAERAVRAEGSCQWMGYDRVLDMRLRAGGALASLSDARLFFARLRCS